VASTRPVWPAVPATVVTVYVVTGGLPSFKLAPLVVTVPKALLTATV